MAHVAQDLLGSLFAVSGVHGFHIAGNRRIGGMDGVVNPRVAVAVFPDPDTHAFEELKRGNKGRELFDSHGRGSYFAGGFPHLHRGAGRGFMRHHGVAGVGLIVDQHLPVAAMHVAQGFPGHFELAFG
ncbi:hypothetical protein D9M72_626010 [compost metagenome]